MLENDNTVLIKGLKKGSDMLIHKTHLIETSYDRVEIKRNHISAIQENLAKAEFSDGLQISMNIKILSP